VNIDCLLLAGGASKRMGEPKMLLGLGSGTLFEHVLSNYLASSVRHITAVVPGWLEGFESLRERCGSDRVDFVALARECEMSRSLKAGWKHAVETWRPDALMVALADKPLVAPGVIDSVIGGYVASGSKICVPVHGGAWGHPVILDIEFGSEIDDLGGDCGAKDIMEAHRDDVAEVAVDTDAILIDVDTLEDFDALRRRLNQGG